MAQLKMPWYRFEFTDDDIGEMRFRSFMLELDRLSDELSMPIDMALFADARTPESSNIFYLPPSAKFHCPEFLELFRAEPTKKPTNVRLQQGRLEAFDRHFSG